MILPFSVAIKSFFGIYVLTPFEEALLEHLSDALGPDDRAILTFQLEHFTTVRRLLKQLDEPNAHGFTNFYTSRFGRSLTDECQTRRFAYSEKESLLATTRVTFEGGEIEVQFWLVTGVLFCMEYRSPQHIYYPPSRYRIEAISVWPRKF